MFTKSKAKSTNIKLRYPINNYKGTNKNSHSQLNLVLIITKFRRIYTELTNNIINSTSLSPKTKRIKPIQISYNTESINETNYNENH